MSLDLARKVLETEAAAIRAVAERLDGAFERAVELMGSAKGRVVACGMGKSGLVLRKVAATLASTGSPSIFLHPAEAIHGDLGMVLPGDVLLAASYSGETEELVRILEYMKRTGIPIVAMTGNPASTLASAADVHLSVAVDREACPNNLAPTASSTATLALGDALALALSVRRGFRPEDFARLHPGGKLGKRLSRVSELMHAAAKVPSVPPEAPLRTLIVEMSRGRLGMAVVADDAGRMLGVVSDGDLRRLLERDADPLARSAADAMSRSPITIPPDRLASEGLRMMEDRKITFLVVTADGASVDGVLHLHDLWGLDLF